MLRALRTWLPSHVFIDDSMPELIDSWMALIVTMSFLPSARAISGVVTMAQAAPSDTPQQRSEEHTSELQSLMRISYAVFCLNKKNKKTKKTIKIQQQANRQNNH